MENRANKPGTYNNFTGRIEVNNNVGEVRNATFEILTDFIFFKGFHYIKVTFQDGDIIGGNLCYTDIKHCNFYNGRLSSSVFRDGIFDGGEFRNSTWLGGEWVSGEWDEGYDKFGRKKIYPPTHWNQADKVEDVVTKPGVYKDFTGWVNYRESNFYIEKGCFEVHERLGNRIVIDEGVITKGELDAPIINYVEFNGDKIRRGKWCGGVWRNGLFESSWCGGVWMNGVWNGGIWKGGFDKNGRWHDRYDSPNKW